MEDSIDHALSREYKERREYQLKVVDGELEPAYDNSQYLGAEPLQTIKCTCGERFLKEELAIEHIHSVNPENEQEVKSS